jgi:hypothetical protein
LEGCGAPVTGVCVAGFLEVSREGGQAECDAAGPVETGTSV